MDSYYDTLNHDIGVLPGISPEQELEAKATVHRYSKGDEEQKQLYLEALGLIPTLRKKEREAQENEDG